MRESDQDFAWWRWFAAFWGLLALVALIARAWGGLGLALTFTTGFLVQELRSRQRTAGAGAPGLVGCAVVTAALGAAGVSLLLRFQFHLTPARWVVPSLFGGLVLLYAAGPSVARALLSRRASSARDE